MSTGGLALGAVVLAIGLVLIFLPLDYSSSGTFYSNYTQFMPSHCGFVALQIVPIPAATYSLGGASLTVNWQVVGTNSATAYLYSLSDALRAENGSGCGSDELQADATPAGSGSLSLSSLTPGTSYGLLYYLQNVNETSSAVATTWSGSMFLPYAELGIPMAGIGAVILVISAALSRPRPAKEEVVQDYPAGAEPPAYELVPRTAPEPVAVAPSPTPSRPAEAPAAKSYPSATTALAPTPSSELAPKPSSAVVATPTHWRARPMPRLGADRPAVVAQSEIAPGRPSVAPAPESSPTPSPAPRPSNAESDPNARTCPKCHLTIGDESWAFCPRCRTELD